MLVGDHFLLNDFGPCGIMFVNVRVAATVSMMMLEGIWGFMPSVHKFIGL
jgi:hypothetical protein